MISVLDYGLRLTTMSQIDLPKLDRAEKNEVLVTVGANTDTLMVTMSRHARVSPDANLTECVFVSDTCQNGKDCMGTRAVKGINYRHLFLVVGVQCP